MNDRTAKLVTGIIDRSGDPRGLLLLLCGSFVLKTLLLFMVDVVSPDSALYLTAAHYYSKGQFAQGIAVYPLPLYPMLLAVFHAVIPNWEWAALPTTLLASVLTIVPLYWLTRDLFGARAGFWAGAAFALSPYLNRYGIYIIRDPSGLFALAWALYFGHRFIANSGKLSILSCLICTLLAAAMRAEVLFFLPLYLVFLIVLGFLRSNKRRSYFIGALIWAGIPLGLIASLMLILPSAWLYITQGDYLSSKIHSAFATELLQNYLNINQDLKELQLAKSYPRRGHNLIDLVRTYMPLIYFIGILECFFRMLYPVYGIPLVYGFKAKPNAGRLLVFATGFVFLSAAYMFLMSENWVSKRYLSFTVLCFLPWVGCGCAGLLEWLRDSSRQITAAILIGLLVLLPLAETVTKHLGHKDHSLRTAGQWLQSQQRAFQDTRISASDNRILIYAQRYADIPRWNENRTLQLKELSDKTKHKLVLIEPLATASADLTSHWDQQVLIQTFEGPDTQIDIYAPPQIRDQLARP